MVKGGPDGRTGGDGSTCPRGSCADRRGRFHVSQGILRWFSPSRIFPWDTGNRPRRSAGFLPCESSPGTLGTVPDGPPVLSLTNLPLGHWEPSPTVRRFSPVRIFPWDAGNRPHPVHWDAGNPIRSAVPPTALPRNIIRENLLEKVSYSLRLQPYYSIMRLKSM